MKLLASWCCRYKKPTRVEGKQDKHSEERSKLGYHTNHRLRKSSHVKMKSLGQNKRKASYMFAQFLLFPRCPLLKADRSSLFLVRFTCSLFGGSVFLDRSTAGYWAEQPLQQHWLSAAACPGPSASPWMASCRRWWCSSLFAVLSGVPSQVEMLCHQVLQQSHTRDTSPTCLGHCCRVGGACDPKEPQPSPQTVRVSSRIAVLLPTPCVLADALPDTDPIRIQSLVWTSMPPLCSLNLFIQF